MKRFLTCLIIGVLATTTFAGCGGSSSPAKPNTVRVPNEVGKPLVQARKSLERIGLKVKETSPGSTFGVVDESNWVVKSQSDHAGATAQKGATVEFIVERPSSSAKSTSLTASTTPAPVTTLIHGQTPVNAIKSQSMSNDPMMTPLVNAEWKGGFLVLTYQSDNAHQAANLCDFVHLNAAPGLTPGQTTQVQVIGATGKELAITRVGGPGCKVKY